MDESLRELESLLRKHGFKGQADAVAHVLTLCRAGDRSAFAQAATGLTMWGGAGSVADVEFRSNSPRPDEEAAADVPRFYRAMIALADGLDREHLGTPRTRDVAKTFRNWLSRAV
jgi:hypothetical protein